MVARILRAGLLKLPIFGVLITIEAYAQTGGLRGRVIDEHDQPVESAQVLISYLGGVTREYEVETNEQGGFIRMGLPSGDYSIIFSKQGHEQMGFDVRVSLGSPTNIGDITMPTISKEMETARRMSELNAEIAGEVEAGIAAAQAEDYAGAIAAFEKALEIHPGSAEAMFNKGFAHFKLGDIAEAEAAYRNAIELDPAKVEPYVELSNIHASRTEWSQAQQMLEKAVQLRPGDVRYQYNLGAVAINAGDHTTAEVAFRSVVDVDPTFAMAHYQLGMVNVSKGANDEAILEFEKYLEIEPEGANASTATGIITQLKQQAQQAN